MSKVGYNRFLLLVAGLGGCFTGGCWIIAGALPYLERLPGLSGNQLSVIVAAVLLGSVISRCSQDALRFVGRKRLMFVSGLLFVISIPTIALSHGYGPLVMGRLLQGISAGLIGVVVPLYLAECLGASNRGKGRPCFNGCSHWHRGGSGHRLLVQLEAAGIGKLNDAQKLFAFKDTAWRSIFWVSLPPGILFCLGSLLVAESPRWLFREGKKTPPAPRCCARARRNRRRLN